MKYMLDTNICSYIIKKKPLSVLEKLKTIPIESCGISSITLAELRYWVGKNKRLHQKSGNIGKPNINEEIIDQFVSHLNIAQFDSLAADVYGEIRAELEQKGKLIGSEDLFIAAHAISVDSVLVTNNIKEFENVPNLMIENWL